MGKRRRKTRTHLKGAQPEEDDQSGPRSFVVRSGAVTRSTNQLVRDMRKVMEPGTASRLKERHASRLRDYLVMAQPLGVTHIMVFTLTEANNVHFRMARLPTGPTLTFRVERYSLMKDLVNASLRNLGKAPGGEYRTPPLLVMNNFQTPAGQPPKPHLKLITSMFQGLFPPIQVEKSALPSFRRVLLVSYHPESNLISIRHYNITVRPHGVSRRVRKILNSTTAGGKEPLSKSSRKVDLSNADDIADYLLKRNKRDGSQAPSEAGTEYTDTTGTGTGWDSASETDGSEAESDSNAVDLPEDYVGRGNKKGERRAVRLVEVGPRMELRLIKIAEGLVGSKRGEGETVFHEFVAKTKSEAAKQKAEHEARLRTKEARRKQQEANVARKQAEKEAKQKAKASKAKATADEDGEAEEEDDDEEEEEDELPEHVAGFSSDDDDEFEYEDKFGPAGGAATKGEDDEEVDWDEEVGDVSEGSDEEGDGQDDSGSESEEEVRAPRPVAKKRK